MALGVRLDPYLSCNFLVEIEGLVVGGFSEVSGLEVKIEVTTYREGGLNDMVHHLPGPASYPNLVLKRGLIDANLLLPWIEAVARGTIERKNGAILLLDNAHQVRMQWIFKGAYPVRWAGPDLRAHAAEVAMETLELAHRGLSRPGGGLQSAASAAGGLIR